VRLVETHISFLLLADALAYKLKKPVRLPFLDFTTLAARCHYCREELRVNRRLAPWLYLDVVDVVDGPAGARLAGPGPVVDVALRMRRFPDGALWSERLAAGVLAPADVDALAAILAAFHARAPEALPQSGHGALAVHERVVGGLLAALPPDGQGPEIAGLRAWLPRECARLAAHFERRRLSGHVRECHGDLHLGNVVQVGDRPSAFDGIEFDESLRWIDPVEDVAFLAMDLLAHGAPTLAWRFLDAWMETTGDWEGLPALRFHLVCRALVRAQVSALREAAGAGESGRPAAADYRMLAWALTRGAEARLAITHGLPGSGKTFAARLLAEHDGALLVRSDVERKRLFGLVSTSSSTAVSGGIYDAATTARTYRRLADVAHAALTAGWPIIVDAAFLRRAERASFARLAQEAGAAFSILDCVAPPALLRERIERRLAAASDASEADLDVLERLTAAEEPLDDVERRVAIVVDAADPPPVEVLVERWRAAH
jgi:hypothetical protein